MLTKRKAAATQATLVLKRAFWRMVCHFAFNLVRIVVDSPSDSEVCGVSVKLSSSGFVSGSNAAATKPTASQATPPNEGIQGDQVIKAALNGVATTSPTSMAAARIKYSDALFHVSICMSHKTPKKLTVYSLEMNL